MKDAKVIELLSLSQLARRCDCAPATIRRRITDGLISIDAESAGAIFVKADRLPEIQSLLAKTAQQNPLTNAV